MGFHTSLTAPLRKESYTEIIIFLFILSFNSFSFALCTHSSFLIPLSLIQSDVVYVG